MLLWGAGLLVAFALAPVVFPDPQFRVTMGDLVPLLVISAAFVVSTRNAFDSRGHTRLFWSLVAAGMAMWCFSQSCWAWYEVVVDRNPLPDPFPGDIVLFLHIVPIMAAVAIRPHQADEREGMLPSALNVLLLLVWWVVVYAFFVFPEEYIAINIPVYSARWDLLYLLEGLILITVSASAFFTSSGAWRELYRNIFFASTLYTFSSEAMNAAMARGPVPDWRNLRPSISRCLCWGFSGRPSPGGGAFATLRCRLRSRPPVSQSLLSLRNSRCSPSLSWDIGHCS